MTYMEAAEEGSRLVGWPAPSNYFDTDLRANGPKRRRQSV